MGKKVLLAGVTANTTGAVFPLQEAINASLCKRLRTEGTLTLTIFGLTNAAAMLYGGSTASRLSLVGGGTFTADATVAMEAIPAFVRADVADYVAGTVYFEVGW